jgi:hypothetical protein
VPRRPRPRRRSNRPEPPTYPPRRFRKPPVPTDERLTRRMTLGNRPFGTTSIRTVPRSNSTSALARPCATGPWQKARPSTRFQMMASRSVWQTVTRIP